MHRKFQDLVNKTMSVDAQRRADELARKQLFEMELAELREALEIRQEDLAEKLKVTQATISRLERRPNVLLASLANYIEGLGGKLELRAVLPDRTVKLTHIFPRAKRNVAVHAARKRQVAFRTTRKRQRVTQGAAG